MSVWDDVVGQEPSVAVLRDAARAARDLHADPSGRGVKPGALTHAWLFTGPPGSGRSVAARAFAAALQCVRDGEPGCGECSGCHTTLTRSHPDVHAVVPEGLSISVAEMRSVVATAARLPALGRWQVVLIEDADRLTEQASNALLKAVEEPPLEDWLELLDAVQRRINRRLLRPEEEATIKKCITERFPDAKIDDTKLPWRGG